MHKIQHPALIVERYFHSLIEPLLPPAQAVARQQAIIDLATDDKTATVILRRLCGTIATMIASLDPQDPLRNLQLDNPIDSTSTVMIADNNGYVAEFDANSVIADLHNTESTDPAEQLESEALSDIDLYSISTLVFLCTIDPVQAQRYIAEDGQAASIDDIEALLDALRFVLHRRRVFVGNDDPGTLVIFYEWANAPVGNIDMPEAIANSTELAHETAIPVGSYNARRRSDGNTPR